MKTQKQEQFEDETSDAFENTAGNEADKPANDVGQAAQKSPAPDPDDCYQPRVTD